MPSLPYKTLVLTLPCLIAFGCAGGGDDEDSGDGDGGNLGGSFVFACDNPAGTNLAAPVHGCADYFASQMADAARVPLEQSCTLNGGTVRDEPCVNTGKVGACVIRTPGTEAFDLYSLDWLYAPSNAAEVQDSCFAGGYDFMQPDGTVVSADEGTADAGTDSGSPVAPPLGTAEARIMHVKEDLDLTVWTGSEGGQPIELIAHLPSFELTDYFEVRAVVPGADPSFIAVPSTVRPAPNQTFASFSSEVRDRNQVGAQLTEGGRTTVFFAPTNVALSTLDVRIRRLDEHLLEPAAPNEARVHFAALSAAERALAVVGGPCLVQGSATPGAQPITMTVLPPGPVTLGTYRADEYGGPDCAEPPQATIDLDLQAGTDTLLMLYAEGAELVLSALPLEVD